MPRTFRDRIWRHRTLVVCVLLIALVTFWPHQAVPTITRTLESSTEQFRVQWVSRNMTPLMVSNSNGTGFALSPLLSSLVAFDMQTGDVDWKVDLPFEQQSARAILANDHNVFVVTTYRVDAYSAATGDLMWSTLLGTGGVSVMGQLDTNIIRIYYGDKLYELDPDTGRILTSESKGNILWVSGHVALHLLPTNQLVALDALSGQQMWTSDHAFRISEGQEPQRAGTGIFIVARAPAFDSAYANGVCALSLQTGGYIWCLDGIYVSRFAVGPDSQVGHILRSDFVLVSIDLRTGSILGETRFLPVVLPKELEQHSQNYSVALSNGVLAVAFSDSGQTFGLSTSH